MLVRNPLGIVTGTNKTAKGVVEAGGFQCALAHLLVHVEQATRVSEDA